MLVRCTLLAVKVRLKHRWAMISFRSLTMAKVIIAVVTALTVGVFLTVAVGTIPMVLIHNVFMASFALLLLLLLLLFW